MAPLQAGNLVGDGHGLSIPLETLPGDLALGGQALRLAGLLQERSAFRERGIQLGPLLAGEHRGATVALEGRESRLALAGDRLRAKDRLLRDSQPARVLLALGLEVPKRPFEAAPGGARAPVGAAD